MSFALFSFVFCRGTQRIEPAQWTLASMTIQDFRQNLIFFPNFLKIAWNWRTRLGYTAAVFSMRSSDFVGDLCMGGDWFDVAKSEAHTKFFMRSSNSESGRGGGGLIWCDKTWNPKGSLRVRSHWALMIMLSLAGITKNGYSTHSLAKFFASLSLRAQCEWDLSSSGCRLGFVGWDEIDIWWAIADFGGKLGTFWQHFPLLSPWHHR